METTLIFSAVQRTEEFQKGRRKAPFFCKMRREWHGNGKRNILGTEKISKLLMQFSIPTVLTLIVNCLYNIVDQIFGRAVGINGVAATNVAFP